MELYKFCTYLTAYNEIKTKKLEQNIRHAKVMNTISALPCKNELAKFFFSLQNHMVQDNTLLLTSPLAQLSTVSETSVYNRTQLLNKLEKLIEQNSVCQHLNDKNILNS